MQNWTTSEGGQNFRRFPMGGKILDFFIFFSMFLKHNDFMFSGYFWHFSFFWSRGDLVVGASKIGRPVKGGGKILDAFG